jgi:SPP1 gp7 family putative phage head morphogenesis protein
VASQIADVVGLTERQAVAVGNFSQALDDAFAGDISEAALRRRYKLSPRVQGRKETILKEYTRRQLRHRGEMIARTETITAFTEGRNAAWNRMRETGALPLGAVMEWITSPDERSCQICIPLHGEQAPVGGSFAGGFAGPPVHPSCRCDTRMILNPENIRRSEGRKEADRFIADRQAELSVP